MENMKTKIINLNLLDMRTVLYSTVLYGTVLYMFRKDGMGQRKWNIRK